jgi:DNA polymerase IIIc chi subunit
MDINFYGITSEDPVKVLITLLDKAVLTQGIRSCILLKNLVELEQLDKSLWSRHLWLPHSIAGDPEENETPIVLYNTEDKELSLKKNIDYLFLLDKSPSPVIDDFKKIFVVFNINNNDSLSYNRARWKTLLNYEANRRFFKQNDDGKFIEIKI